MAEKLLDDRLDMRVNKEVKQAFMDRCNKAGRQYQEVLREVMTAFNEGRLRIEVSEEQLNNLENFYHVPGK